MKATNKHMGSLGKLMILAIGAAPAIAFSDYPGHTVRERVDEGLHLAAAAKVVVSDNVKKAAPDLSKGWTSQDLTGLTHFVSSIHIDPATGVITLAYTEHAGNIIITLTPTAGGASLAAGTTPFEAISWKCVVSDAGANKYVPNICRS